MRLLLVGLNPSIYSADIGAGFARPGNRFWPAALAAGIVTRTHDPFHTLRIDGIGMTDLGEAGGPPAPTSSRAEEVSASEPHASNDSSSGSSPARCASSDSAATASRSTARRLQAGNHKSFGGAGRPT